MNKKRAEIEKTVYDVMNLLDKSGYNANFYKEFFGKMSDTEFDSYMKSFLANDRENFYLEVEPFTDKEPKIEDIKKAADYLHVPLTEYMWMPFANPDGEALRTKTEVPVGYLHLKRLQQILSKKNTMSTSISQRDRKTNQVTSHDKSGRVSDAENYALVAKNADAALREFMGPRADDAVAKQAMFKDIQTYGAVKMQDLPYDIENKVALNLADVYFMGAHIMTDMVTPGLETIYTLKEKKQKDLQQERYKK